MRLSVEKSLTIENNAGDCKQYEIETEPLVIGLFDCPAHYLDCKQTRNRRDDESDCYAPAELGSCDLEGVRKARFLIHYALCKLNDEAAEYYGNGHEEGEL